MSGVITNVGGKDELPKFDTTIRLGSDAPDLRNGPSNDYGDPQIGYPEMCRPIESGNPKVNATIEDLLCVIGDLWPNREEHEIMFTKLRLQMGCALGVSAQFNSDGHLVLRVNS